MRTSFDADAASSNSSPPQASELSRQRLEEGVRRADLPMILISLPGGETVEVNAAAERLLQRDRHALMTARARQFTEDPDGAKLFLARLAQGRLLGYSHLVRLPMPHGETVELAVRTQACPGTTGVDFATVTLVPTASSASSVSSVSSASSLLPPMAAHAAVPVLGTISGSGVIDRIVADATGVLPHPAQEMLGRNLVELIHPEDAAAISLLATHARTSSSATRGLVRLRDGGGNWYAANVALQPLAPEHADGTAVPGFSFAFSAIPEDPEDQGRDEDLNASGVRESASPPARGRPMSWLSTLPGLVPHPGLAALTKRQVEIVGRLVSGQRVPAIARDMFVSQSTVRNHLTGVYRSFGVGSQVELLDELRPRLFTECECNLDPAVDSSSRQTPRTARCAPGVSPRLEIA